jgi:hypothetical protein
MDLYRITHWPEPTPTNSNLPIRKAMAAMSVGWVTRSWLEDEIRLSEREVDSMLEELDLQGALARRKVSTLPTKAPGIAARARRLLRDVTIYFAGAARNRHPWYPDGAHYGHTSTLILKVSVLPPSSGGAAGTGVQDKSIAVRT